MITHLQSNDALFAAIEADKDDRSPGAVRYPDGR